MSDLVVRPAFGIFLETLWREKKMHQAEFCRRIGKPAGWVQQIRQGTKTPPLAEMAKWATVLELEGAELQYFLDLAAIAHLPSKAHTRFLHLAAKEWTLRNAKSYVYRSGATDTPPKPKHTPVRRSGTDS